MITEVDSDADLMVRVSAGDRDAFAALVDRYKDPMVSYLTRLTGNRARAEDLAQESFVRLFQAAPRYSEQGKLIAFLYRIATNLARSEDRRVRRWSLLRGRFASAHPHGVDSPQADLLRQELHARVSEAIAALPLAYRVPLVLHEIEGWSYEQVAQVTGAPEGTVKSRINRARQRLKEELAPYWQSGNGGAA
ncbi:MAG: sigma-70 family RNA polymerase sigma factor [Acidobacteria bacterium]|nr:sigma-70 family RNA polymerase sigma factor [Acidobacteriota bacterium]